MTLTGIITLRESGARSNVKEVAIHTCQRSIIEISPLDAFYYYIHATRIFYAKS